MKKTHLSSWIVASLSRSVKWTVAITAMLLSIMVMVSYLTNRGNVSIKPDNVFKDFKTAITGQFSSKESGNMLLNNRKKPNDIKKAAKKEKKPIDTNSNFVYEQPKPINYREDDSPFVPPKLDRNCLRTIPDEYTDFKGDTAVIIPPAHILSEMDEEVVACIFQRYVTSLQTHCAQPELVGRLQKIKRPGVGGWNVCVDQNYRPVDPCIVYSFSKTYRDDSFAASMAATFHCEVHTFHKSQTVTKKTNGVFSHKLWETDGLSNTDTPQALTTIMSSLGHENRVLDILTMDIDGEEWVVLKDYITKGTIKKIRQLSIVIHGPYENDTKQDYIERLIILKSLYLQGFRIFWANRNWDAKFQSHQKRTSEHVLNLVQISGANVPPQHLVIPGDEEVARMDPLYRGDFFHRYCTSAQIHCKELVRMGKMISGGWDICNDKEWKLQSPCLVYSFGINFDFSFDDEVSEYYGCEVHSFDPSMKTKDYKQAPRVYYHDSGIGPSNNIRSAWRLRTLQTFKNELGHANLNLDILKMDVEFAEWGSVLEMIKNGSLTNVTQFLLEIHLAHINDASTKYIDGFKYFRNIYNEGFRIFWSHRNPFCVFTASDSKKERDACYEVYFLNINKKKIRSL